MELLIVYFGLTDKEMKAFILSNSLIYIDLIKSYFTSYVRTHYIIMKL